MGGNLSDFAKKSDKFRLVLSAGDTTQGNLPESLRRGWEGGTVRSFLKRLAPESSVQLPG